jgi:hypothetical protein
MITIELKQNSLFKAKVKKGVFSSTQFAYKTKSTPHEVCFLHPYENCESPTGILGV